MNSARITVLAFVCFIGGAANAITTGTEDLSSSQIIDSVQYSVNQAGQATIEVRFNVPVIIRKRIPQDRASRTEAHLEFQLTELQKRSLPLEEVRMADKNIEIPLRSVAYDGFNISDPILSITFDRMVAYRVEQGGGDSVKITLPEIKPQAAPMNLVSAEEAERIKAKLRQRRLAQTQGSPTAVEPAASVATTPAAIAPAPAPARSSVRKNTPPPMLPPTNKTESAMGSFALPPSSAAGNQANDNAMTILMTQGRAALTRGDNVASIELFTKVLNARDHSFHADAEELLALARERNGQIAYAKRLYEHYLKIYPKGEGHERVQQRLTELSTPEPVLAGTLKLTKAATKVFDNSVFGSVSVFGFQGQSYSKTRDGREIKGANVSTVQSYLNMNGRFRSANMDFRTVAYGTMTKRNDLDDNDEAPPLLEANRVYLELKDTKWDYNMRLGRQSGNSGGIFGRFDGMQIGYDLFPKFRPSVSYGFSVDFTSDDTIQNNMPFVSANVSMGTFFKYLEISPYYITQAIDGINNRTGLGVEARFGHPKFNIFGTMDYEPNYAVMNLMMLNTLWRMTEASTLSINVDDRKSPLLQTRNALFNQNFRTTCLHPDDTNLPDSPVITDTVAKGLLTCDEQTIRDLALNNTGHSQFVTLALNHSFSDDFQLNADISRIETQIVGFVQEELDITKFKEEIENADQMAVSIQSVFSHVFQQRDSNIIGLRYANDTAYDSYQLTLSNRLMLGQSWRFNARLLADQRDNKGDRVGSSQLRLRPSLKLDYRYKRMFEVQTELSYEQIVNNTTSQFTGTPTEDSGNYLFTLGIRQDF